jgi:hypothetical protein
MKLSSYIRKLLQSFSIRNYLKLSKALNLSYTKIFNISLPEGQLIT